MGYLITGVLSFIGGVIVARLYWTEAIQYGKNELAKIKAKL